MFGVNKEETKHKQMATGFGFGSASGFGTSAQIPAFGGSVSASAPASAPAPAPATTTTGSPLFNHGLVTTTATSAPSSSTEKENKKTEFKIPQESLPTNTATPWREVKWTEDQRTSLMESVASYRPSCEDVPRARVLLLGPVGSGKSSFISSVQSVFSGRVTNRAMVGHSSSSSFTKKLQPFNIRGPEGDGHTALDLCDMMGLGDGDMTGPTLHDILTVIKGHAPEGYKFSPDQVLSSETEGFVKRPSLKDKIHCVVFVLDACKVVYGFNSKGLSVALQHLRECICDLGVHQVALLTHVDKICQETGKNVSEVYKSRAIREMISKAGDLLGMSTSYIVPVKNYSSELDVDVNTDVLLLQAVDHILQYTDLFFKDVAEQRVHSVKPY